MEWNPSGVRSMVLKEGERMVFVARQPWPPFQLTAHVRNLLMDYSELMKRWDCLKGDEPVIFAGLHHDIGEALRRLSIQSQHFGLDPSPIYEFLDFKCPKTLAELREAEDKLISFMLRYEDRAEVLWQQEQAGLTVNEAAPKVAADAPVQARQQRIEDWEPYQQIQRLRSELAPAWANKVRSGDTCKPGVHPELWKLYGAYRNALFAVAKWAEVWGLDATPAFRLAEVDDKAAHPEFEDRIEAFGHFLLVCLTRAEARWELMKNEKSTAQVGAPPNNPNAAEAVKPDAISVAVALKSKHPEWSDRQVAKAAGCSPSTLSRSKVYQRVKQVYGGDAPPRGSKDGKTGDIEAFDE